MCKWSSLNTKILDRDRKYLARLKEEIAAFETQPLAADIIKDFGWLKDYVPKN